METIKKIYRVDRREIAYLRFIFEAYDGLAVLSTIDARKGLVSLDIPPGCEADVDNIMTDLEEDIMIEFVSVEEIDLRDSQ